MKDASRKVQAPAAPPGLTVRRARPADLEFVVESFEGLIRNEISQGYDTTIQPARTRRKQNLERLCKAIRARTRCVFLAEWNGRPIGHLYATSYKLPWRIPPLLAEAGTLFVSPRHRGKGAGKALLKAFLSWAKSKGAGRARIVASVPNAGAIRLYRKMGFRDFELILEQGL